MPGKWREATAPALLLSQPTSVRYSVAALSHSAVAVAQLGPAPRRFRVEPSSAAEMTIGRWNAPGRPDQAVTGAVVCLWSLSKLWVALMSRHSDLHADLPRRKKRSQRRLNFVWANTGSIMVWRRA
jgi:hypothetical protein